MLEQIKNSDCICGKEHFFASKIVAENGAVKQLPKILSDMGVQKVFLIADENTYRAAGEKVVALLENTDFKVKKYIFSDAALEPNEANVGLAVMNFDNSCDVVIGVGSGTINDIGKIVANVSGKKYVIVGTAPSMDGYASATSSMSVEGLKISLNSRCADVIIGDIDILREAPINMMISGLGDMLAKYVSICEWRISNVINGEYYCEAIANLVRTSLKKCVDNVDGYLNRDNEAVKAVFEGLVITGAAMKLAGCSRPASGVEHYLSHVLDMRGVQFGIPVDFHGVQCADGTLFAIKLYEKIKRITPDEKKALDYVRSFDFSAWSEELREFLGKGAEGMITLEKKERKYDLIKHEKRIKIIIDKWEEILKIINEELPDISELEKVLKKIGLVESFEDKYKDILTLTFKATKDIRDKYVLSRLCWDLGIIDFICSEENLNVI